MASLLDTYCCTILWFKIPPIATNQENPVRNSHFDNPVTQSGFKHLAASQHL